MRTTDRYNDPLGTAADFETNGSYADAGTTTVAAAFADKETAHDVVHQLHDEGFHDTWIGITRRDDVAGYTTPNADLRPSDYAAPPEYAAPADYRAPNDNSTGREDDDVRLRTPAGAAADARRVESENWFMRFFGEGDESLHDALVRHGVSEADARAAGTFPAHSAILTVNGSNHPELAAQIMARAGGQLITRSFGADADRSVNTAAGIGSAYTATTSPSAADMRADDVRTDRTIASDRTMVSPAEDELERKYAPPATNAAADPELATNDYATDASFADRDVRKAGMTQPMTASGDAEMTQPMPASGKADVTSYDDFGNYRAGKPLDESTRLQLREERLRVDKSRIDRGVATVGTDVVTETQDVDVPFTREEQFIERRPAKGATVLSTPGMGEGETIRVPLSEDA
jgi:stress response protein YsnF